MAHSMFRKGAIGMWLLALALALAATATAQTAAGSTAAGASMTAPAKGGALASADKTFVQKAAIGGMVEVQMGNLAQQKASSDLVKQFGARMVTDHTKANDELKQIASGKGIDLPSVLDRKHQADVDHMSELAGAPFDKAYMSYMVGDHKTDIADFKKQASSGKDAELKAYASKTLPTLQEHLQMAQAAKAAVKKARAK